MLTLLDYENAILDLFEMNRIPVQDAKIVLWTILTAIYNNELAATILLLSANNGLRKSIYLCIIGT
jgi:hypothetical protein